jgi:hypothetical protein
MLKIVELSFIIALTGDRTVRRDSISYDFYNSIENLSNWISNQLVLLRIVKNCNGKSEKISSGTFSSMESVKTRHY